MNLTIGNDVGNSENKMHIDNNYIHQPSCYSRVMKIPNMDDVNPDAVQHDIYNNIMITINSPCVPAGTYYVGRKALNGGLAIYNMDIVDKKNISDVYYINTLSLISAYAVSNLVKNDDNLVKVNIDMACSLPVSQYSKNEASIVREKLQGIHYTSIFLGNKKINLELNFEYIKVLPESVPIVFALQKENSNIDNKKILHASIGEGTTEYPLTDGIDFNPDFIKGSSNGIGHAMEKAIEPFKNKLGLRTYTRQKYSEVIQTNHKFTSIAKDLLQEHLNTEAQDIQRYIRNEVQKANAEIDYIVIHGGGSILIREHLENRLKEFCDNKQIEVIFIEKDKAVKFESYGLYLFTQTNIFKHLKAIYKKK